MPRRDQTVDQFFILGPKFQFQCRQAGMNLFLLAVVVVAFWVYKSATPGKLAMSARVVDADTGTALSTAPPARPDQRRPAGPAPGRTAGCGCVATASQDSQHDLQQGLLVDLLPHLRLRAAIIRAVFPSRRGLLPTVRELIDFPAAEFAKPALAERGDASARVRRS